MTTKRPPWQIGCFAFLAVIGVAILLTACVTLFPVVPMRLLEFVQGAALWVALAAGAVAYFIARGYQ